MQDGFTFLELIITLGIFAILALLGLPQYDGFLSRHQARTDVDQLVRLITLTRQHALLRGEVMTLCPNDLSECGDDWSLGLLLIDETRNTVTATGFKHQARIFLKTFPAGYEHLLQFGGNGYTQMQNGSFYYCPQDILHAQRIVFNQAGRVYVTVENAIQECE